MQDKASVTVKALSGGERRRLDLALALLGAPELLLLDEPTAGLDAESRRRVWNLVRALVADGTAVLLTTHHLEEAEQLADRLAVLHRGRIVAGGTLQEVVATHRAEVRWVATAGHPPAGVLDGAETVSRDGRHVLVRTNHLQRTLSRVLTWADGADLALPELRATPASLETAFLALASTDETPTAEPPTAEPPTAEPPTDRTSPSTLESVR